VSDQHFLVENKAILAKEYLNIIGGIDNGIKIGD